MNRVERQLLLSERAALQELLARSAPSDVLGAGSLRFRLAAIQAALNQIPDETRMPARVRVTFRGKPVVGSYGVLADFGMAATQAFTDTVSKVAASLGGPLASMGPIPKKSQNQLLITGTAVGSFGFQLEEHREEPLLIDDGSAVVDALAATQGLLEATTGDDDSLAEAAAGMDPRAIAALRAFLSVLADHEAVCAVTFGGRSFEFSDVGQVQLALARLAVDNLIEVQTTKTGQFQGVLPTSRTFEFKLTDSSEVIKGRIGPAVTSPDDLNQLLHQVVTITLTETRVGAGRPRYMLDSLPVLADPSSGQMA
jgi:hypothetical protein